MKIKLDAKAQIDLKKECLEFIIKTHNPTNTHPIVTNSINIVEASKILYDYLITEETDISLDNKPRNNKITGIDYV